MIPMEDCAHFWEVGCHIKNAAQDIMDSFFGAIIGSIVEGLNSILTSVATFWVKLPTPDLTGGNDPGVAPGEAGANSGSISQLIGWIAWIGLAVCVVSLIIAGGILAFRRHHEATQSGQRILAVLVGAAVVSGASSLAGWFGGLGSPQRSGTVGFLQSSLWWYTLALVIVSLIIGGAKMAWEGRAEPGRQLIGSLAGFLLRSTIGVSAIGLAIGASDGFSTWILGKATECNMSVGGDCFSKQLIKLLAVPSSGSAIGLVVILVLGILAVLASLIQAVLMLMRSGLLVVLVGVWPASAALGNTKAGQSWRDKIDGWIVAFILYKPAAAIIYAASIKLASTDIFGGGDDLMAFLAGLLLMVVALVALPALMKLAVPAVGALGGGGGSGVLGALGLAAMAIPAGAAVAPAIAGAAGAGSAAAGAAGAANAAGASSSVIPGGAPLAGPGGGGVGGGAPPGGTPSAPPGGGGGSSSAPAGGGGTSGTPAGSGPAGDGSGAAPWRQGGGSPWSPGGVGASGSSAAPPASGGQGYGSADSYPIVDVPGGAVTAHSQPAGGGTWTPAAASPPAVTSASPPVSLGGGGVSAPPVSGAPPVTPPSGPAPRPAFRPPVQLPPADDSDGYI